MSLGFKNKYRRDYKEKGFEREKFGEVKENGMSRLRKIAFIAT